MPGFDWNGNGERDVFDSYMDMEIMSEYSSDSDDEFFDDEDASDDFALDDFEVTNDVDDITVKRARLTGTLRNISAQKEIVTFQDELKQYLRSPKEIEREKTERENNAMMTEATLMLYKIKRALADNAKKGEYTTQNGVTTLSCLCPINRRAYLRNRREDNMKEIKEDQQKFFLFRDSSLVYRSWECFDVCPEYRNEYNQYVAALRKLAAEENINIEIVIHNARENKIRPFPIRVPTDYSIGWYLCVRASVTIPSGKDVSVESQQLPR